MAQKRCRKMKTKLLEAGLKQIGNLSDITYK